MGGTLTTSFVVDHEGKQYEGTLEITYDTDGEVEDVECVKAFDEDGNELSEIQIDDIWWKIEEFVEAGNFDDQPTAEDFMPDTLEEKRGER